jgi:hypothetical protein
MFSTGLKVLPVPDTDAVKVSRHLKIKIEEN